MYFIKKKFFTVAIALSFAFNLLMPFDVSYAEDLTEDVQTIQLANTKKSVKSSKNKTTAKTGKNKKTKKKIKTENVEKTENAENVETIAQEAPKAEEPLKLNVPVVKTVEIAPGLTEKIYKVLKEDGPVTAYFLEADKNRYSLLPALDRDEIPGRDTTSNIARQHGAIAGINASYFAVNGELLGVTKINGQTVGTTYIRRTALGINQNGNMHMGRITYQGYAILGDITLPVSGVDAECGENGVVIFNRYYGNSTKSNIYVKCYVVEDGQVTHIQSGDTRIPPNGFVIGVHGKTIETVQGVQVGDKAGFFENLGKSWSNDTHILGAGPQLVRDGQPFVSVEKEKFPGDIRYGRNPRSGFGITRDGNYLFAVVDGRQRNYSIGVTLTEFAHLFMDFGAMFAMNFDGGGSSALYVNGRTVNSPSDGSERRVASALLLIEK